MPSLIVVLHPGPASGNVLTVCLHLIQGEHLTAIIFIFSAIRNKILFYVLNGRLNGRK